jgi:hypothetical protein
MTHEGGISVDTPPKLWSVCVGMPMTGLRLLNATMLRHSL